MSDMSSSVTSGFHLLFSRSLHAFPFLRSDIHAVLDVRGESFCSHPTGLCHWSLCKAFETCSFYWADRCCHCHAVDISVTLAGCLQRLRMWCQLCSTLAWFVGRDSSAVFCCQQVMGTYKHTTKFLQLFFVRTSLWQVTYARARTSLLF